VGCFSILLFYTVRIFWSQNGLNAAKAKTEEKHGKHRAKQRLQTTAKSSKKSRFRLVVSRRQKGKHEQKAEEHEARSH
jgi:hypothetical protein